MSRAPAARTPVPIGSSRLGPPVLGRGRFPPAPISVPVEGVEYCCAAAGALEAEVLVAGALDAGVLLAGAELAGVLPPGRSSQAIPS